ncbi:MAG: hypothetical protein ACK47M_24865, partial [Caldilinea sp.]
ATLQLINPAHDGVADTVAVHEPMTQRVMVEAPASTRARFLHLVQGADDGASPTTASVIHTEDGFVGLAVKQSIVLFSEDWEQPFHQLRYSALGGVNRHILTGLPANTGFSVSLETTNDEVRVTVLPGGEVRTDAAGVLVLSAGAHQDAFLPLVSTGS